MLDEDAEHNMSTWLATMEYEQPNLHFIAKVRLHYSLKYHFGRFMPSSRIILNVFNEMDVGYIQIADDRVYSDTVVKKVMYLSVPYK